MCSSASSAAETAPLAESPVELCLDISADELTDDARERAHVLFRDALGVILGSTTTTELSKMVRDMVSVV